MMTARTDDLPRWHKLIKTVLGDMPKTKDRRKKKPSKSNDGHREKV